MSRDNIVKQLLFSENSSIDRRRGLLKLQDLFLQMVPTDVNEGCSSCTASDDCSGPVSAVGNVEASVVLVGRNPGKEEDRSGIPFSGPGGKLLDSFIRWVGLDRDNLYITNILKCFTEGNRVPTPEELNTCSVKWLQPEFTLLKPKLVVTFGEEACFAMRASKMSQSRFKSQVYPEGVGSLSGVTVVSCIHPGAVLHNARMMPSFRDDATYVRSTCSSLGILVDPQIANVVTQSVPENPLFGLL